MKRQQPKSTLFPYTTLFRSDRAAETVDTRFEDQPEVAAAVHITIGNAYRSLGDFAKDRKSTRLNSSHMSISYAVFCLKKKKIIRFIIISIYFYFIDFMVLLF